MRRHAADYDAIIVDGIWQFPSLGTWLALRGSKTPYSVVLHGFLSPWLHNKYRLKHLKKLVYWVLAEYWVLRDACAVFYTCEQEKVLAQQSFWPYSAKEVVAGLGIEKPSGDSYYQQQLFFGRYPELRGKRLILFVGRIDPIKGCDLLIEAFARVSHTDSELQLVMVGGDQKGWQQKLQGRVAEIGLQDRVTFTGALADDIKWGAFKSAEVLVLPSHSENFGLVVAEAMACGVPVLISDKVNIWQEVEDSGGGFVASDDVEGTTSLLEKWLGLTPYERRVMERKAEEGFVKNFSLRVALEKFALILCAVSRRENLGTEQSP